MRFNKVIRLFMMILMLAIVTGCGNPSGTALKSSEETIAEVSQGEKMTLPEEKPVLIGKVKEVIGNEVTLYKAEILQNERNPGERSGRQPQDQNAGQANQAQNQTQTNAGSTPENRGLRMQFSEETETFIIPVGTPIVTMQRGTGEATEVGLAGIKKDTILRIWKTADTISFVQAANGGGAMGNRQSGNNGTRTGGSGGTQGMGGPPPGM